MNNSDRDIIQARICYEFKNPLLLEAAFTHASYANEHSGVANERIEFLGDCVLNFLVGERLFMQDPSAQEGALSSRRAAIVSRKPLARIIDRFGFIEFLSVGAGVDKRSFSEKKRSDIFEALLGAVYLDGGMDAARKALDSIFYPFVMPESDYKTALQKYAVERGVDIDYVAEPNGDMFTATVTVGGDKFAGDGRSKHEAEIAAAENAYKALTFGFVR